ncbi:MAG: hypothetical protein JXK94_12255 [Deltaproteobacteria bacterium]|nr:hypothetical protein [Deltaproteobacteria bacterium]
MAVQQEKHQESPKKSPDFWKSTRKTLHAASFGAQKYKRLVQKKMDLNTNNRKFPALFSELGKLIDDMYSRGETDILARAEVHDLLSRLRALKETAVLLENEIENIKLENPEKKAEDETVLKDNEKSD